MSRDQSYDEFILGLYAALLKDCAVHYPRLSKEFDRDLSRLRSSLEHHGTRFFTETMPLYRKHFDQCLDTGLLTRTPLVNFGSWRRRGGTVPRLFRGLFLRVFELTGKLVDHPDAQAVRLIRQLLGAVRKIRSECEPVDVYNCVDELYQVDGELLNGIPEVWDATVSVHQSREAYSVSFIDVVEPRNEDANSDTEGSVRQSSSCDEESSPSIAVQQELMNYVQRVADIVASTLGSFEPGDWNYRHGPGSVSDHGFGTCKYKFTSWPDRLESVFPIADFGFANYQHWVDAINAGEIDDISSNEQMSHLHAVPKTITGPRLIASEPASMQWCQQAIRDFLYTSVSKTTFSRFIDFRRQDLNGALALRASHGGTHMTIDLSSASDHISCWHVERMLRRNPTLLEACIASRSAYVYQDICKSSPSAYKLKKYATMGNATIFPIQSLLYCIMAMAAELYTRKLPVSYSSIQLISGEDVRVFGDDIIVPNTASWAMLAILKLLRMKVNPNKTFGGKHFRESCGIDAFDGNNVTAVNVLEMPVQANPGSIVSSVDVHNNLLSAGYLWTATYIRKTVEQLGYSAIRVVKHGSGAFGWSDLIDSNSPRLRSRWNPDLCRREIRCLDLTVKCHRKPTEGNYGLLQFFTEAAKIVTTAYSTLSYLIRRPKVRLNLRWAPAL